MLSPPYWPPIVNQADKLGLFTQFEPDVFFNVCSGQIELAYVI